jgi:hypothetical protein
MPGKVRTPLGAVMVGTLAGIAGTGLMTAWQAAAAKLQSSGRSGSEPDSEPSDPWEQASAPAQVARRIGEGVFKHPMSPDLIPLLTNAMHWGYGTGWGTAYAIVTVGRRRSGVLRGAGFGTAVWAMSYAQLVPMGLYEPPWTYEPAELALDLSYHLVYGIGVAAALRPLTQ